MIIQYPFVMNWPAPSYIVAIAIVIKIWWCVFWMAGLNIMMSALYNMWLLLWSQNQGEMYGEIFKMALSKGIECHLFFFWSSLTGLIRKELTRKLINDTEINIQFGPAIICTVSLPCLGFFHLMGFNVCYSLSLISAKNQFLQ